MNLTEDISDFHTSKHRTEGQEGGSGDTIGRPGDGGCLCVCRCMCVCEEAQGSCEIKQKLQ